MDNIPFDVNDFVEAMKGISAFINDRYKGLRTTRPNRDLCKDLLSKVFIHKFSLAR